jgi:phenylalanyl-tRNA synthetase beta chain
MNPLGAELSVMRQTLLFGGLESIARNRNHRQNNLKFYEFGACYHYNASKKTEEKPLAAYSEETHLGIWMCGNNSDISWTDGERKLTFFDLKAHVINCLTRIGIAPASYVVVPFESDIYSQAIALQTRGGKVIAQLGIVSKAQLKAFDIDTDVFYADINWPVVLKQLKNSKVTYREISKYPEVKRDLALLLDKTITFQQIEDIAFEVEKKILKKVVLFDVYEGKNLEPGKISYAVNFTLQDTEKTLQDKQIDNVMQRLIKAFQDKLGATIR